MSLVASVFGMVGVVAVGAGILGYRKARSVPSLIAGAVSGSALLAAAGLVASGWGALGLGLGSMTCAALAGRFVPTFVRTRRMMPHGVMAVLSGAGLLSALVASVSSRG
jgi:uncharacterized membrane protein (UPF0136 family)